MKNQSHLSYHLLPTEDASHLFLSSTGMLLFDKTSKTSSDNKHIYLTSEAEIKKGDWVYSISLEMILKVASGQYSDSWLKIILTTDPKLIADGVPAIDGKTKALVEIDMIIRKSYVEVNFLEEFCKRYNQNDNQKVDIKQLASDMASDESEYRGFIEGFKACQALQSSAGGFSLEDILNLIENKIKGWTSPTLKDHSGTVNGIIIETLTEIKSEIQSMTKSQTKGDIVIGVEMEGIYAHKQEIGSELVGQRIKLDKDGQPILTFK